MMMKLIYFEIIDYTRPFKIKIINFIDASNKILICNEN